MAYCGQHSAVKEEPAQRTVVSLRCRSWHCPDCADARRLQLIAEAIGGRPNTFLTLTSRRHDATTAEAAAAALTHAWRVVRKRALREASRDIAKNPRPFGARPKQGWKSHPLGENRRRVSLDGKGLPFIAVVEKTQLGWPHLHILLRSRWIDQEWLSAQMAELIDSPNVHIDRITNRAKRAGYCAKYCSKATEKFVSTKRYWQSQDYDLRPAHKRTDGGGPQVPWERRMTTMRFLVGVWLRQGYTVTFLSDVKAVAVRKQVRIPDG